MIIRSLYIKSVAAILIVTATLKIITLAEGGRKLGVADPLIFFFSNRVLIWFAMMIELIVAFNLLFLSDLRRRLLLILWLSCIFLVYHLGLLVTGYKFSCYCAGTPFSWEVVFPFNGKVIIQFLLAYMLTGSSLFLLKDRVERHANRPKRLKKVTSQDMFQT